MALKIFANTSYLSEAANDFKKNKGVYTRAPRGSKDYKEYWAEHKRRCKQGYSIGDVKITGRHYFYLNFCPIKRTEKKSDGSWNVMQSKELLFPAFWEIDYNWWWAKEIAMFGMLEEGVRGLQIDGLPVKDYTTGKHLSCLKTRRAGFSYKEAADGVWNYMFIPASKSYYFAAKEDYLIKDGILNKVDTYLEHLNTNTGDYWRRNRMVKNTPMYKRASYLDKRRDEKGYKSEIIGVIIDDPDKVRGKDGIKITYEEAGSFKNLKKALAISRPSVEEGAVMTGQISVFGTGGEEGPDIEGLEDIFLEPEAYNMLEFKNIWEEGQEDTVCGYFVPCTHANQSFMDGDGNIDLIGALGFSEAQREAKKKLKDPKELDRVVAEFPRNPSEALQRLSANIFPVAEAQAVLRKLEKNEAVLSTLRHGVLYQGESGPKFKPEKDLHAITQFPHKNDDDLTGCVTIDLPPEKDGSGRTPEGKYICVVDPFYKEQAEDRTSLWACYIVKQKSMGDPYGDMICAWYVARPHLLEIAYRNTVLLAKMYGAKIQSEIAGGGQGLYQYMLSKKLLGMAEYQPLTFNNKEQGTNLKNRSYFMNVSTEDKKNGISYFANWLSEQRGLNHLGEPVLNIHMIKDAALLREIIKFNPDPKKNFDRVSAMAIAMFMLKENEAYAPPPPTDMSAFYLNTLSGGDEEGYDGSNQYTSLDDLLV